MSQDVLRLARQGDARSIALLIHQALEPRGVRVRALREQNCLHVLLEGAQVPPEKFARLVRGGIVCLGLTSINSLRVYGRQAGRLMPAWTQEWTLRSTESAQSVQPKQSVQSTQPPQPTRSIAAPPTPPGSTTRSRVIVSPPSPIRGPAAVQPRSIASPPQRTSSRRNVAQPIHSQPISSQPIHSQPILADRISQPLSSPKSTASRTPKSAKRSAERLAKRRVVFPFSWQQATGKLGLLVPIAFSAGVVVAVGWNQLFADQPHVARQPETDLDDAAAKATSNQSTQTSTIALTPIAKPQDSLQSQVAASPVPAAVPVSNLAQPALTIKAVGDMILGTNYPNYRLPDQDGIWLFDGVKPFFDGADILFGNFESTLTDYPNSAKDISQGQTFAFRTPPSYANLLQQVGFDVLSVANNHSLDFGDQGFADTIAHIQQTGMQAVGQKNQIVYTTVNGVKMAFIAFSYFPEHNSILDLDAGRALVEEAKQQANIVVISVHAGAEGTDARHTRNETEYFFGENRGNLVEFSHAMVDQGADLILGHGPHIPRAMELYKSRLIAYSLGNFVGYRTLSTDGALSYSLILDAQLSDQGEFLTGRIIPVRLDDQGVPFVDDSFKSVSFVRNLIESDFPITPLLIDESGKILRNEAPLPAT